MMGQITQISISNGGVPKVSVPTAVVTVDGVVGDRQANRTYHGGPTRAVCLWSQDIIDQLQAEGHPIAAGSAGENITIRGLDWSTLIPCTQLCLGSEVIIEITDYAAPCRKNMRWFSDRKYGRMSQKRYPGQSRLYAKVIAPGTIHQTDPVSVMPEA